MKLACCQRGVLYWKKASCQKCPNLPFLPTWTHPVDKNSRKIQFYHFIGIWPLTPTYIKSCQKSSVIGSMVRAAESAMYQQTAVFSWKCYVTPPIKRFLENVLLRPVNWLCNLLWYDVALSCFKMLLFMTKSDKWSFVPFCGMKNAWALTHLPRPAL